MTCTEPSLSVIVPCCHLLSCFHNCFFILILLSYKGTECRHSWHQLNKGFDLSLLKLRCYFAMPLKLSLIYLALRIACHIGTFVNVNGYFTQLSLEPTKGSTEKVNKIIFRRKILNETEMVSNFLYYKIEMTGRNDLLSELQPV